MSTFIPEWFVQQYTRNVVMRVQQEDSRLRNAVLIEPIVGKSGFVDRMGKVLAQERTERHKDSPLDVTPHSRRRIDLKDYEWGDLVDDQDKIRLLNDPTSRYVINAGWAMGRQIDSSIITAFNAAAFTGAGGAGDPVGTDPFDPANIIANDFEIGGTALSGLTLDKILEAKRILDASDVPDGDRFFAVGSQQLQDLLDDPKVQSIDQNTVKALVRGEIDTWVGFTFIRTELLILTGTDRECYAWSKSGMVLGLGQDIKAEIAPRPDKAFSTYVYVSMTIGATRVEEERVVQVLCDET